MHGHGVKVAVTRPNEAELVPAGEASRPRIVVLYHYFHPDDVVSASHYAQLCTGLVAKGWDVTVFTANRSRHRDGVRYPRYERWKGMAIHRLWRPPLPQASIVGRVLNALWMVGAWFVAIARSKASLRPDVVLIGTDPILSV